MHYNFLYFYKTLVIITPNNFPYLNLIFLAVIKSGIINLLYSNLIGNPSI